MLSAKSDVRYVQWRKAPGRVVRRTGSPPRPQNKHPRSKKRGWTEDLVAGARNQRYLQLDFARL